MPTSESKTEQNTFNICFFGARLDVDNLGVRVLASSLINLAQEAPEQNRVVLVYANQSGGTRNHPIAHSKQVPVTIANFRISPRVALKNHAAFIILLALLARISPNNAIRRRIISISPTLQAIADANFIGDVFGGDVFSDIYGLRAFATLCIPFAAAHILSKKITLLPQTYGPFSSPFTRILARAIIRRASTVYSRDSQSIEAIRNLFPKTSKIPNVHFSPDVGFILEPIPPRHCTYIPPLPKPNTTIIGINISGLLYTGNYTKNRDFDLKCNYPSFVQQLITSLLSTAPEAHVVLIPHTFEQGPHSDQDASRAVFHRLAPETSSRLHMVGDRYDEFQTKFLLGECDFFIGSRMHACIGAISQCIPTVAVAYSHKFNGVFASIGLSSSVVDARYFDAHTCVDKCLQGFQERERIRSNLNVVIPPLKERIRTHFRQLLTSGA